METTMENLPTLTPQLNGRNLVTLEDSQVSSLPMPIQVDRIVERVQAVQEIVNKVFKDDVHFGKIPGTGDKKTLLKPGFDALCLAFQFSPEFIKQPESIERDNFINLVYKCRIIHSATGRVIATGDGSCNSKEEKYRWTTLARTCPTCGKEAIAKSKEEWGGGWYCNAKKDGCGAKFKKGDRSIEEQEAGRKENDNPWNFHNTLTKMAQKRAGMAAIITACGLSGDFTQDMEDFEPQAHDKRQRGEAGIDVRAQYEDRRDETGADVYPWPGSEDPRPSGESPNQPQPPPPVDEFASRSQAPEPPPNVDQSVALAFAEVAKELSFCKVKGDFQKTKGFMEARGGAYLHPVVTNLVNMRYAQMFPAKPKTL
jgi:hypothetical protein